MASVLLLFPLKQKAVQFDNRCQTSRGNHTTFWVDWDCIWTGEAHRAWWWRRDYYTGFTPIGIQIWTWNAAVSKWCSESSLVQNIYFMNTCRNTQLKIYSSPLMDSSHTWLSSSISPTGDPWYVILNIHCSKKWNKNRVLMTLNMVKEGWGEEVCLLLRGIQVYVHRYL